MSLKSVTHTLPSGDIRKVEWDGKVPGLHLRQGRASAVWYLMYRDRRNGRQRRYKIGDYRVYSRSKARDRAVELLAEVAKGSDPANLIDNPDNLRTVSDLFRSYEEHARHRLKPRSWDGCYEPAWRTHILPRIGKKAVVDVTASDAETIHHALRDRPYQANRTIATLHRAFHLAKRWGWVKDNPITVERYRETARKRVPTLEEAVRLFEAMDEMKGEHPCFIGLIELLILTGCRKNEIMASRREWVKDDGLHLPDSNSKTGQRVVALSSHARAVIASLPRAKDNPYLIVGRVGGEHLKDPKGLWRTLVEKAEITDLRMHDLRRYFASIGLSVGGFTLEAVGQLLGHRQFQTTKRYAYLMESATIQATEVIGSLMVNPEKMLAAAKRKERSRRQKSSASIRPARRSTVAVRSISTPSNA